MKPAAALLIVVVLVMLAQRGQATDNAYSIEGTAPGSGVLTGRVTRGPLTPVQQPGTPSESEVSGARIDIATLDGKLVTSVETDSAGTFRADLPAGTYKITMPSLYGAMFSKDLPAIVSISGGEEKRLNIHLDTGIR